MAYTPGEGGGVTPHMKVVGMLACIASISRRVRRESWDESKKKRNERGGGRE